MNRGLMIAVAVLMSCICHAGYVVDVQLPGTNTVVTLTVQTNGTAYHPFDITADDGMKIGTRIGITNFVVSLSGAALSLHADQKIPIAWQTFTNDGKIIRSPIAKVSGVSASLSNLFLNVWVPLGGILDASTSSTNSAQIRIRKEDSQQSRGTLRR